MTQAPTPGPLLNGDIVRGPNGQIETVKSANPDFVVLVSGNGYLPSLVTFIGRPDADGWMPWSGGENPVPGQAVEVKFEGGLVSEVLDSECFAWDRHKDPVVAPLYDIIAFRLAPTAPVEASGSLDETVTEVAVSTIRWAMGRGDDLRDYKEPLEHVLTAALRTQPSGETREDRLSAALIAMVEHFERVDAAPEDKAAIQAACEVWAGVKRDKALSTTPARAEAQDEGAAGPLTDDQWPLAYERLKGEIPHPDQGIALVGCDDLAMALYRLDQFAALAMENAAHAHPSPTPAADADRVREAHEQAVRLRRLKHRLLQRKATLGDMDELVEVIQFLEMSPVSLQATSEAN